METIESQAQDLQLGSLSHLSEHENREIWRLYLMGYDVSAIAAKMNRTQAAIHRSLGRNPEYRTEDDPTWRGSVCFGRKDVPYYDSDLEQLNAMISGPKLFKFPDNDIAALFITNIHAIHDTRPGN